MSRRNKKILSVLRKVLIVLCNSIYIVSSIITITQNNQM